MNIYIRPHTSMVILGLSNAPVELAYFLHMIPGNYITYAEEVERSECQTINLKTPTMLCFSYKKYSMVFYELPSGLCINGDTRLSELKSASTKQKDLSFYLRDPKNKTYSKLLQRP